MSSALLSTPHTGPRAGGARPHPLGAHPLSAMQQGMLVNSLLEPGSGSEVEQFIIHLHHAVDADLLCAAWREVSERHEILRTAFRWQGVETAEQVVWSGVEPSFEVLEWTGDEAYAAWLRADRLRELTLDAAPLQRLALFRRADDEHTLVWTFHHALLDGRAMVLVLRDVFSLYEARLEGREIELPALRPYRDYTAWFAAQDWSASEGFWRALLDGVPSSTAVPLMGPAREGTNTEEFLQRSIRVPAADTAALEALAAERGLTLNAMVQAAWAVLLARHAGEDDVVFGTTRACRRSAAGGAETIVGPTFNTVPVRVRLHAGATLLDAAEQVREQSVSVRPHENTPLQRIQEWCGAPGAPLFQTLAVFEFQPMTETLARLGGGWPRRSVQILRKSNFPLTLSAYGGAQALLTLTYDPTRFPADAIDRLLGHLRALLVAMAKDPSRPANEVDLLSDDERETLDAWSQGPALQMAPATFPAQFAERVRMTPDSVALIHAGASLTCAELDARSNRLANHLIRLGVGAEVRVGLCMERTPELVVSQLAVLKAGGTYVPVEPHFPADRIASVMRDAGASIVLARGGSMESARAVDSARVIDLDVVADAVAAESDAAPNVDIHPEMLSHVIYTSGSTGKPKGVMIRHGSVGAFVAWMRSRFPLAEGERVLASTSFSFDVHVAEIHFGLSAGYPLVLVRDALALAELDASTAATLKQASMVPSAAHELARMGAIPAGLRRINLGGEPVALDVSRALYAAGVEEVGNAYGPTEDTTYSTFAHITADADRVTVGRPLGARRMYVLDAALRPVPAGVVGDVYMAGVGVSRGYLGRPDMTAEKFLPDALSAEPGARMYAVGDRGRWLENGELEYLGRADFQVKIRGFRIEPGEIESVLRSHPAIHNAVVVARGAEGDKRLVAYVIATDDVAPPAEVLAAHVAARLPEYMVPSAFVAMSAFPLTSSGKIDRKVLPEPEWTAEARAFAAPRGPVETAVAEILAQVLGVDRMGADDDFFALGGHSLMATRAVSRLRQAFSVELPLRVLFEARTVRTLAARVQEARGADAAPAILPVPRDGRLPLSFAQERMWLLDQVEPDRAAYVIPTAIRLRGALDAAALGRALREFVRRHEAVRTTFRETDGAPVQVVWGGEASPLRKEDVSHLPAGEREDAMRRRAADEALRPFDLAAGPLYRFTLIRLADDDHALLLSFHHSIFDGWSLGVLYRELSALYAAFARGESPALAPLPVQYADFAAWQRTALSGDALRRDLAWWMETLAGAPALLELPTDRPRPAVRTGRGARVRAELPRELAQAVDALARAESATPYMVLMAAFQAFLARYSGQTDVVVGSPIAGRTRPEVQELAGLFVNTLALRADVSDDPSFGALLARTRDATLGAYAHQELPFEKLVEALQPERTTRHAPVFQAMLALQDADAAPVLAGVEAEVLHRELATAKFDLTLMLRPGADGITATLEYSTELWDASTAERMLARFAALLRGAVSTPATRVSALPLMDAVDAAAMDALHVGPALERAADVFPAQFAARVRMTPDAIALIHAGRTTTYAELDARSNRLANHLMRLGVGAEVRVGLCMERTPELVVSQLAVLKAGGTYVPVEPHFPADRIASVMRDAGASIVLARGGSMESARAVDSARVIDLDVVADAVAAESADAPNVDIHPEMLSHVIYTSGSTGKPKGVMIRHGSVGAFVAWMRSRFPLAEGERVLASTSFSFDVHVAEIHFGLSAGHPLVLVRDALAVVEMDPAFPVTQASMVPSAAHELARMGAIPAGLRRMNLGGEPVALDVSRALYAAGVEEVGNAYGPTEDTTYSTFAHIAQDAVRVTVGRQLAARRMYVLDAALRPVPAGVVGDVYMAGAGVSRGYLGRPDMTAEKFLPDALSAEPGARMYAVGDRGRWLENGELEYLGRADFQVKIRGFRIEPGEIESVLRSHAAVHNAVVAARGADGEKRLVAWVVAVEGTHPTAAELAAWVGERLPAYMVPAAFVQVDAYPLTSSGKIDRNSLPEPVWADAERAFIAPRTDDERTVAAAFAEVLGIDTVGADDDFFVLGGHSLLATRAVSRLRRALGIELPLRVVFESSTVAALAAEAGRIRAEASAGSVDIDAIVPVADGQALPLSFAQERLWFLHQLDAGSVAYNVPSAWKLTGALDVPALRRALAEIVRRHASLRTVFRATAEGAEQVIVPASPVVLDVVEMDEAEAMERALADGFAPFDLAAGPLYRFALTRTGADAHLLTLHLHHAVTDGWSSGVLLGELSALYAAFAAGQASPLAEPVLRYADFAAWQRARMAGDALEGRMSYWRDRLAGAPAVLELPTDRPRTNNDARPAARMRAVLPRAVWEGVEALARAENATPYMVLLAAFQALMARYSGQDDVVVGSPVAGRTRGETEGMIGFFVNTLPLRAEMQDGPAFRALLARVRETVLGAFAHQDVPVERLVAELAPDRASGRAPLFQVAFALQSADEGAPALPGIAAEAVAMDGGTAKFDLLLALRDRADGIHAILEYAADLWDAATAERMLEHFRVLVTAACAHPDTRIADLPLASADERRAITRFSATAPEQVDAAGLLSRIRANALRTPDAAAVEMDGIVLTYAELDARANRLARHLRALGVDGEARVGICLPRGAELVTAVLAVLRAGGAYVPIDPAYPAERRAYMLADSGAVALVTRQSLAAELEPGTVPLVLVDADASAIARHDAGALPCADAGQALAYVIYTSGSTGRPKGVEVTRRGLRNLVDWHLGAFALAAGDRTTLVAGVGFDASAWEIWPALAAGAALHVPGDEVRGDPAALQAWMVERGITSSFLPTPLAEAVLPLHWPADTPLRALLTGGDALRIRPSADLPFQLVNNYGPTECAVVATSGAVAAAGAGAPDIGGPIGGARTYVVDDAMRPVPVGLAGELVVGGAGVARGYGGRPALTAEKFIPDPFGVEPGARMYRTGDRVRWTADGRIEFLGRIDQQVKIRGYRIEPGEIEAALLARAGVREAVVIVRNAPDARLVAYVAADSVDVAALRDALKAELPEYMVPAAMVVMDALPVTANGKLDRTALPEPEWTDAAVEFVAPRTEEEAAVAEIWKQVLGVERVGAMDDFFALGGHSLLATRVVVRLRERFGVELPLRAVFECSTVQAMAAGVAESAAREKAATEEIVGRDAAAQLMERIDELSDEEMDRLLATLSLDGND